MDLTQYLVGAQSIDQKIREQAQAALRTAEESNLPVFLVSLVTELANDLKPPESRQMAGLILKNTMTSKDEEKKKRLELQWMNLDATTKSAIKCQVLQTLESNTKEARLTAAQVCARIAAIELPAGQWNDLIPTLLNFLQGAKNDFQRESTLTCVGYICEESDAEILSQYSNEILTAVVQGLRKEEPSLEIRYSATKALLNSLEFISGNMENENERNYLMGQVCEATQASDVRIRVVSMQCLAKIVSLYYEKLKPYMQALFGLTLDAVRKDDEKVGLQGIEFWTTMAEVEIRLIQEQAGAGCEFYVKGALKHLIDLLLNCLTKQSEDHDEWNVASAAGSCLCLVAQVVENDVVSCVMPFISTNVNNSDWRHREAAILAFGSILDGPTTEILSSLVDQAVPMMLVHMGDEKPIVRDSTAWTVGRIADLHPESIMSKYLKPVLEAVMKSLQDTPHVAAKGCWCIQNICRFFDNVDEPLQNYPLSEVFQAMVQILLTTIDREDAYEDNLRPAAYESLNALLTSCALDCLETVKQLVPVLLTRLMKTLEMSMAGGKERQEQSTVQALLCGSLQVVTRKLKEGVIPFTDQMMQIFLQVFSSSPTTVHEESLMAVSAIASELGSDFEKYMPHFAPFLYKGLRSYQESQVCNLAVGTVNDLAGALGQKLYPYCDEILTILLEDLRQPELNRDVKPSIIASFGDIALCIGGLFEKYFAVMTVLDQAGKTKVPENDEEMVEYLNTLRENLCSAYTGILQGLKPDKADIFLPFIGQVLQLIDLIATDTNSDDGVSRVAVGLVGDLANVLGNKIRNALQQGSIQKMIYVSSTSTEEDTREAARWAMEQCQALR